MTGGACDALPECKKAKDMGEFLGVGTLLNKLFDMYLPGNSWADWCAEPHRTWALCCRAQEV